MTTITTGTTTGSFTVRRLLIEGLSLLRRNLRLIAIPALCYALLSTVYLYAVARLGVLPWYFYIAYPLISLLVWFWLTFVFVQVIDGGAISLKLASRFVRDRFGPYLVMALYVTAKVTLGLLLLIVPGLIWLYRLVFAQSLVLFEGRAVNAVEGSRHLVKQYSRLVIRLLLLFGLFIVAMFLFTMPELAIFPRPVAMVLWFFIYLFSIVLLFIWLFIVRRLWRNMEYRGNYYAITHTQNPSLSGALGLAVAALVLLGVYLLGAALIGNWF